MNEAQLELFRAAILRVLDANSTRYGLTAEALVAHLPRFGFQEPTDAVERELAYLQDKGFAAPTNKPLNPRNTAWRITAQGRDVL